MWLGWLTGAGLVLFTMHGEWATWRNGDGNVLFFTPALGAVILLGVGAYLWYKKRLSLGPKKIWLPLLVILLAIGLRSIVDLSIQSLLELGIATSLASSYFIGRSLGLETLRLFVPYTLVSSTLVISYVFLESDWDRWWTLLNGGYLNELNYEATSAIIVFGTVVGLLLIRRRLWKVVYLVIGFLGTVLTGSPQGVLCLGALVFFVLVRRDIHKYLTVSVLVLLILLSLWFTIGAGQEQFQKTSRALETVKQGALLDEEHEDYHWGQNRIPAYISTLEEVSIVGHGYSVYSTSETGRKTVENVPLVVLDQVGIFAALAWLFVTCWSFTKGNLRYIWLMLIMLGMFDHTTWTMLAPHWWLVVGITTVYTGKDYIFKNETTKKDL